MDSKFLNLNDNIDKLTQVIDADNLIKIQDIVSKIFIKEELVDKLLQFVDWSRNEELLYY
jgi:hypothetical protein